MSREPSLRTSNVVLVVELCMVSFESNRHAAPHPKLSKAKGGHFPLCTKVFSTSL